MCDIASGKSLFSTTGLALAYSPDGRWLAIRAADDKTVLLLDARTHETIARFSGHENMVVPGRVQSRQPLPRLVRSRIAPYAYGKSSSGECRVLRGHTDVVYAVAFHPDGTRLATAARDGAVWLWDLARDEEVVRLAGTRASSGRWPSARTGRRWLPAPATIRFACGILRR